MFKNIDLDEMINKAEREKRSDIFLSKKERLFNIAGLTPKTRTAKRKKKKK